METLYGKSLNRFSLILLITSTMAACSGDLTYQEAINRNERKIGDPGKLADAKFLVEAKSFNMLEWKLAELATTSGYAASIVNFAKKNISDFEQMDEEIEKLARKEKITLPSRMNDQHQASYYEISKASRQNFDKEFLSAMKRYNEENLEGYLQMATQAKDADVRAFAARKLDMMRIHGERVAEVDQELLNTY